jgi:hypothetical protein
MPSEKALVALRVIGRQLDRQIYPSVHGGGLVRPNEIAIGPQLAGKEKDDVEGRRRQEGSEERGERAREAGKSWPAGAAAPFIVGGLYETYREQLTTVCDAYPGSRFWLQDEGFWLLAKSDVLDDLDRRAVFLVAVPFDARQTLQSWGFWTSGSSGFIAWIGPRHTNFPLGSICAFWPGDGTWRNGGSLVQLLDIYSVWAARQLHLELLGRWPGSQLSPWVYERRFETIPGELCGCGSLDKTYDKCCKTRDEQRKVLPDNIEFLFATGGGERKPPSSLFQFIRAPVSPPSVCGDFFA